MPVTATVSHRFYRSKVIRFPSIKAAAPEAVTPLSGHALLDDNICRLLNEAKPDGTVERREDERRPFFRPVTILLVGGERGRTGFSREISTLGIGLVHAFPLQQFDEVIVNPVRVSRERPLPSDIPDLHEYLTRTNYE